MEGNVWNFKGTKEPCVIGIKRKGHPCTGTETLYSPYGPWGGGRGIALPFHDHDTRRGRGVSVTLRPHFPPRKDPVPIVHEAWWAPGPVWRGAENLAPPGFDPRTFQPVTSRYTDYATRPTCVIGVLLYYQCICTVCGYDGCRWR